MVGRGVVLGIDRTGHGWNFGPGQPRGGGKRQGGMAGVRAAGLVGAAGGWADAAIQRVVLGVDDRDGVASAVEDEEPAAVVALDGIDRADTDRDAARDRVAGGLQRIHFPIHTHRGGRDVALHAGGSGDVLADGEVALADRARAHDADRRRSHGDGFVEVQRASDINIGDGLTGGGDRTGAAQIGGPQTGGWGKQVHRPRQTRQREVIHVLGLQVVRSGEVGHGAVAVDGVPGGTGFIQGEGGGAGAEIGLRHHGVT